MLLYEEHHADRQHIEAAHKPVVVIALAFSPDGANLASSASDGSFCIRNANGEVRYYADLREEHNSIHSIGYLPDGRLLIGDSFAFCWFEPSKRPPASHPRRRESDLHSPYYTAIAIIDSDTIACGTGCPAKERAGKLQLYDLKSNGSIPVEFHDAGGIFKISACPRKKMIAWSTGSRKITLWEIEKQDQTHFSVAKSSSALALAPDGHYLAVAVDYEIKVYDLIKHRESAQLKGHKGRVTCVAVSPDSSTLATGSWDNSVRLWDLATGRLRTSFAWPIGRVTCLAYAPDGLRLAAGGDLGKVVVWDME